MSQIFKVYHLGDSGVTHILLFIGSIEIIDTSDLSPPKYSIFTKDEWENIQKNNIPYSVIPAYLHGDDTITTIKRKIVYHGQKYLPVRSTKELYLFAIKQEKLDPSVVFQQLTQEDSLPLTPQRLCQFLLNIVPNGCRDIQPETQCHLAKLEDKEIYDFEDMTNIPGLSWDEHHSLTIPIGQKLVLRKIYPFVSNPYNCVDIDSVLKRDVSNMITTQNSNLLFEYGEICANTIFICTAYETLRYATEIHSLTEKDMLNLYFPLLVQDNILSLTELREKQQHLADEQKKILGRTFEKRNERVDIFYKVFDERKSQLQYLQGTPGIIAIDFTIHPVHLIKFPLEILFKLIHSTEKIPLVKYNPGTRKENIYRLYTAGNVATNGKQIPYLYTQYGNRKGKIIRLSRAIAKHKRVAFYIEILHKSTLYELVCEFESNGNINVALPLTQPLHLDDIEDIVRESINGPILDKVRSFLEQSGYSYVTFHSLKDKNIEIRKLTFVSSLVIRKNIHLKNYLGCLSSVFNILEGDLSATSDRISLKYKRVSNFNVLDAEEAFINELRRQGATAEEVIRELKMNFQLSTDDAKARFANWAQNVRTETDLFENKKITVRTNTGFPVFITRNRSNFHTTVTVESIDNLHYIHFLHVYLDSLLRLIIDKTSTKVKPAVISRLCKGKQLKDIMETEDLEKIPTRIPVAQKLILDEDVEDEQEAMAFFDLLGDDEEEDDADDEEEGGIEFGESIDFGDTIEFGDAIGDTLTPHESAKKKSPQKSTTPKEEEKIPSPVSDIQSTVGSVSDVTSMAEADLTGLPLAGGDNIFMRKKLTRDPELFLKQSDQKYKAYSKACPSQYRKQPVILNAEEKRYIDSHDKAFGVRSYDEFVTYGSGPKKYHYICPRFWCLYDENGKERSITLQEINEGKCGGWDALIPDKAKKIPKGKRIYQFTDKRFHKEGVDTNNPLVYKPMFPGFQAPHSHPKGLCIPCCFTRPNTANPEMKWIKSKNGYVGRFDGKKRKTPIQPQILDGRAELEDSEYKQRVMYKPRGPGIQGEAKWKGDGPAFKVKADGNIDLSSIGGKNVEAQTREPPAIARTRTLETCDQTSGMESMRFVERTRGGIKPPKADEAPLWETFPLRTEQLGYLSEPLQRFLGYDQRSNDRRLIINKPYLLRQGVEASDTQSFLACIADIYYNRQHDSETENIRITGKTKLSIRALKRIIADRLSIDNFVTYQNGTLVKLFQTDKDVSFVRYKQTRLYKAVMKMQGKNDTGTRYLTIVIGAFENFLRFLNDDAVIIDYTYLWDIICMPRNDATREGGLFKGGLNLLIFNSPSDDITDKIEVICPTNHYSTQVFDINRDILILYSRNGYFEPIYKVIKVVGNRYNISRTFRLATISSFAPEIAPVLRAIRKNMVEACRPLPSMPRAYNKTKGFRSNIPLKILVEEIERGVAGYNIAAQIANYDTKSIGLLLETTGGERIYIPCRPSAIDPEFDLIFVGSPHLWSSLSSTVKQLRHLHTVTKGKIPCLPQIKVIEDAVVVGIITQTNQFIPVIPEPYQEPPAGTKAEPEGLKSIHLDRTESGLNYLAIDRDTLVSDTVDKERLTVVKKIKLESNFFNVFRNTLRMALSTDDNISAKSVLETLIYNPLLTYLKKLQALDTRLRHILTPYVEFTDYNLSTIDDIEKLSKCLGLKRKACDSRSTCTFSHTDGVCKLHIPSKNLINGANNSQQYYGRLADELIRHDRIRTFMFKPQAFLSFQELSYDLRNNEIILLEELLYGGYFDDMVQRSVNPYINTNSLFDIVEPAKTVPYAQSYTLGDKLETSAISRCIVQDPSQLKLTLGHWRDNGLGKPFELLEFKYSTECNWEMMVEIISNRTETNVTANELRTHLVSIYRKILTPTQGPQILTALRNQGKVAIASAIERGTAIGTVLTLTNYYLSQLDILLLALHYKAPILLMSRSRIPTLGTNAVSFIQEDSQFAYIVFGGHWPDAKTTRHPALGLVALHSNIRLPKEALLPIKDNFNKHCFTSLQSYLTRANAMIKKRVKLKRPTRVRTMKSGEKPKAKKLTGKLKLGVGKK